MAARRDLRLPLTGRLLRAFGFGFASILLGVHMQSRGLAPGEIGLVLAIGLAAASLTGLVSAAASGKRRRRQVLAATGLLMALLVLRYLWHGIPDTIRDQTNVKHHQATMRYEMLAVGTTPPTSIEAPLPQWSLF